MTTPNRSFGLLEPSLCTSGSRSGRAGTLLPVGGLVEPIWPYSGGMEANWCLPLRTCWDSPPSRWAEVGPIWPHFGGMEVNWCNPTPDVPGLSSPISGPKWDRRKI